MSTPRNNESNMTEVGMNVETRWYSVFTFFDSVLMLLKRKSKTISVSLGNVPNRA